MNKTLVIVFVKNIVPGKVKTRLAQTIGNFGATEVYSELVNHTKKTISEVSSMDKRIYYSNEIIEDLFDGNLKFIQRGNDLGERMLNAFKDGFNDGYENIILIGSDLPDLSPYHLIEASETLKSKDLVFGPAEDGGYYLIGMSSLILEVFENKPWSQAHLLETTLLGLESTSFTYGLLELLNDIDTYEDLIASKFYKLNFKLQEKLQQPND